MIHGYPEERKALCEWLVLMADSNAPEVKQLAIEDREKQRVLEELEELSKNREEWMNMLADKYEEITRNSELKYAVEQGEKRGKEIGRVECEISKIRKKLQKKLSLSEIADMLELEVDYVEQVVQLIEEFPQKSDMEIVEKLL